MGSKVISFRIPEDLAEKFEQKCKDEGGNPADKLRGFVDSVCYPPKEEPTEETKEGELEALTAKVEAFAARMQALEEREVEAVAEDFMAELAGKFKALETRIDGIDKVIAELKGGGEGEKKGEEKTEETEETEEPPKEKVVEIKGKEDGTKASKDNKSIFPLDFSPLFSPGKGQDKGGKK